MKQFRIIFSILGIAAFGVIAFYVTKDMINGANYIDLSSTYSVIRFALFLLLYISLFYISVSCLIGKKGNVGFILECIAVIGMPAYMIIETGLTYPLYLVAGVFGLAGLVLHIIKMKTKAYILGAVSSGLLLLAVIALSDFRSYKFSIIFLIATYVAIAVSDFAYTSAQLSNRMRPVMNKSEVPKKDEVKEEKPVKKEEKPHTESAPAQVVVQEHKGKKLRQWTDEYGFTYTNLP